MESEDPGRSWPSWREPLWGLSGTSAFTSDRKKLACVVERTDGAGVKDVKERKLAKELSEGRGGLVRAAGLFTLTANWPWRRGGMSSCSVWISLLGRPWRRWTRR